MKDKLIAKQKELIETFYDKPNNPPLVWFIQRDKLLLEIALLEKQIEEQEEKPFYDEDYLQECIEKATPNLSKIKDVDKQLDEIRGIDVKENFEKITKAVDLDNKKIVYDGCMITFSGIVIDLFNPNPELILLEDIAHGLANNSRWNGHTQKFWSIAQHCCMMYDEAPDNEKLNHLFHDAEEAYWGDMIKPLKNLIRDNCPEIIEKMKLMRRIIFTKFNIAPLTLTTMNNDFLCLQWEFENIIKKSNAEFWLPEQAKIEWLKRYNNKLEIKRRNKPLKQDK